MSKYPDCFPKDFENKILPKSAHFEEIECYRVLINGLTHESFLSSFEEHILGIRVMPHIDMKNPSIYSTSLNTDVMEIKKLLKIKARREPKAKIGKGITSKKYGKILKNENTNHIDWWLFKDNKAEKDFVIYE